MSSPDRSVRRALAAGAGLAVVGLASLTATIVVGNRDQTSALTAAAQEADDPAASSPTTVVSVQSETTPSAAESPTSSELQATETSLTQPAPTQPLSSSVSVASILPASSTSSAPSRSGGTSTSILAPTATIDSPIRRLHAGPITVSHVGRLYTFALPGSVCTRNVTWTFKGPEGKEPPEEVPCDHLSDQLNHKLQTGTNTVSVELSDSSGNQTSSITFDVE